MSRKIAATVIMLIITSAVFIGTIGDDSNGSNITCHITENKTIIFNPEDLDVFISYTDENGIPYKISLHTYPEKTFDNLDAEIFAKVYDNKYCILMNGTFISETLEESKKIKLNELPNTTITIETGNRLFNLIDTNGNTVAKDVIIDQEFNITKYPTINGYKVIWNTSITGDGFDFVLGKNTMPVGILDLLTDANRKVNDIILYPKQIDIFTLTLNADGGTINNSNWVKSSDGYTAEFNMYSEITLPSPKKDGYRFTGWYNGETKVNELDGLTEDTFLTAKWSAISTPSQDEPQNDTPKPAEDGSQTSVTYVYSITIFETVDSEEPYAVITADDEMPVIEREGFDFVGWQTEDGEVFDIDSVGSDMNVYGIWEAIPEEPKEPEPIVDEPVRQETGADDGTAAIIAVAAVFVASFVVKMAIPYLSSRRK